jgi:putative nucleotidyltransferase with HDIG domain
LALLAHQAFDAVISDLRMPGISGLDLLRQARQVDPHLAFLMATGVDDIHVGIQAMKEGADDYLVKPFQPDAVVLSVIRALDKRNLERELANRQKYLEEMVNQQTRQLQVAMRRIERTYDDTLEALAASLDLRDNETAGHSRRVMRDCLEIARRMECTSEQVKNITRGAYLHDIGKIGVPDAILRKPAKLTEEERQIMESHVRIGYELVCHVAFLASTAEIILTHHERFDGTGYLQGLMGTEIPLGSRIFAVADTLDAMTSDRPYRRALPYSAAREEIIRESGHQFDPAVVQVFLSIPEETLENIRDGRRFFESTQAVEAAEPVALSPGQPAGTRA